MTTLMLVVYVVSVLVTGLAISLTKDIFKEASEAALEGFNETAISHGKKEVSGVGVILLKVMSYFVIVGLVTIPVVNTVFLLKALKGAIKRIKTKLNK